MQGKPISHNDWPTKIHFIATKYWIQSVFFQLAHFMLVFFFPKYTSKTMFVVNINWQYFVLYNMNNTPIENAIFKLFIF